MNKQKKISFLLTSLLILANLPGQGLAFQDSAKLETISIQKLPNELEVSIELEGKFSYQNFELSDPPRLVIEFTPVRKILASNSFDVHDFGVERVRVSQYQELTTRVVLDFSTPKPLYLINYTEKGLKITILPSRRLASPPTTPQKPEKATEKKKEDVPRTTEEAPLTKKPRAQKLEDTMIGLILSKYNISSEEFVEIYGQGSSFRGFDISHLIFSQDDFHLGLAVEARWLSKAGFSTFSQEPTKLTIKPLSIALRCFFSTDYFVPFVGVGLDRYTYQEECVLQDTSGSKSGRHFQAGFYLQLPQMPYIKIKGFGKFTRLITTENELEVNLGGSEFGINLCISFNLR